MSDFPDLGNDQIGNTSVSAKEYDQLMLCMGRYHKIMEFAGCTGGGDKQFERFLYEMGRLKGFKEGAEEVSNR